MLKTSPSTRPSSWPASRSMSRYSQGVLARKLVNRPCEARRRRLPSATTLSATSCSASRPVSPRSSIMILKPPAVPRPSTGGAPKTLTRPSVTSSCERRLQPRGDGVAGQLVRRAVRGSRRASRTSSRSSGRWRSSRIDWPAIATVCLTPGVCERDLLDPAHRPRCGPLDRRRVGQLHVDQQVALVLRRDEAVGVRREAVVGQVEQPAVDDQHEEADAEQPADDRGVAARWPRRSRR